MHDSSIFNIRIDFQKSHDSYIYDKNTQSHFLDFFGLYASLPLGYSHPIFKSEAFIEEFTRIAGIKVPNCEIISDEAQSFLHEFTNHPSMKPFQYFHFCCTGALAIEAAIKIAIDQKKSKTPHIVSFKESFHGINSYGGFLTDRFPPVSKRLDGFPEMGWTKIHSPKMIYKGNSVDSQATANGMEIFLEEFQSCLKKVGAENVAALLVEPIQATFGDSYYSLDFFKVIRRLCDEHGIALIFDEIQTGFATTGAMWYFEHIGIQPDIVAFGKKAQTSGVMVKSTFGATFSNPIRLEVTWDGNLCDMVRSKYILRAYNEYGILANVNARSQQMLQGLKAISQLHRVRGQGAFMAFDFGQGSQRDEFFKRCVQAKFMSNKTRDLTVRLRPNLNVSAAEVDAALTIIKKALV